MTTNSAAFIASRAALAQIGDQRVWSIIVTLFGDLAQQADDRISGPLLSQIIEQIGIKPEAMRVALHRLRKDGWISSEKSGRTSMYRLTDYGRKQSREASFRIYARVLNLPDVWHVLVAKPMPKKERTEYSNALIAKGYILIGTGVLLKNGPAGGAVTDAFVIEGNQFNVPDWLRQNIGLEQMQDAYKLLQKTLKSVQKNLDRDPEISTLEVVVLRVLLVHNWRYLVLRSTDLPQDFYPNDWSEPSCRKLTHEILDRLGLPSLAQLNLAFE